MYDQCTFKCVLNAGHRGFKAASWTFFFMLLASPVIPKGELHFEAINKIMHIDVHYFIYYFKVNSPFGMTGEARSIK